MTTRRLDDIPGYDAWKLMTPEDAEESYGREMFNDDDDSKRGLAPRCAPTARTRFAASTACRLKFAPSNAGPDTTTHGNATSTNVTTHTHESPTP